LQTVVAGQQAENLLDFDAEEPTSSGGSNMFGSMDNEATQSVIATAAKSVNPLDELMDLFSSSSMAPSLPSQPAGVPQYALSPSTTGAGNSDAFSGLVGMAASAGSGPAQQSGSGGLGGGLDDLMSPTVSSPAQTGSNGVSAVAQQKKPAGQEEDLLGLF
jgi:hypothetical protein